ncbi:MAG TPA: hypothetical protein VHE35_29125 [Kofleriaceae bacterium]|nr:hypothetical protein [Kofleriaceae bacterium]
MVGPARGCHLHEAPGWLAGCALLAALGVADTGCRGRGDRKRAPAAGPLDAADTLARVADAGVSGVAAPSSATTGGFLDPDVTAAARPPVRPSRERHPVQLLLRSTPGGALAAVDGVALGPTPVLWEGEANGTPHDFTFRLAGHALARYRFVPLTSGVVHGTLVPIPADELTSAMTSPPIDDRVDPRPSLPPAETVDANAAAPPVAIDAGVSATMTADSDAAAP